MTRSELLPAPGRGAYDRSLSRAERVAQHRERLLLAATEVLNDGALSVARVVERAGVGRSTFYEFFDSPQHLREHLEQRLLRSLELALDKALVDARTPLERMRAIARAWLAELSARPSEARIALAPRPGSELLSSAGQLLHRTLQKSAAAAREGGLGWMSAADEPSLLAATAAVEVVSRRHLAGPALPDVQRALADVMMKLLR